MNFKRIRKSAALVLSAVLAASAVPFSGITASAVDTDLSGNTMLQSDEITLGKLVSGAITENDDDDWYKFLRRRQRYVLEPRIYVRRHK